jgi:hypothetical protein
MNPIEGSTLTHHAMMVAWGQYAHCIGLIQGLESVSLHQKTRTHSPQTKVIEFLVAILSGLEYLKDLSLSAHPLDKDLVTAQAWGQPSWADHSGVSRTLSDLTEDESKQIVSVLEQVSQPMIDREVVLACGAGRIELDADLSPRSVSDTSTTYTGAAYGYMSDHIGMGFQAALVTFRSPTYGRISLSVVQHPGNTVSCTQAKALILAAEKRLGRRPLRRTDLLEQRIAGMEAQGTNLRERITQAQQELESRRAELSKVTELATQYRIV